MKYRIIVPVAAILTAFGLGMAYTVDKSQAQTKGSHVTIEQPAPKAVTTTTQNPTAPASASKANATPTRPASVNIANEQTAPGDVTPTPASTPAPTATPNPLANPQTGAPPGYFRNSNGNLVPAGTGGIYP